MMCLKILCVVVFVSGVLAKDEMLETLYGVQSRNKVSICVAAPSGRLRRCDGALYNREWVVARARCLATAPAEHMTAVRLDTGGSCDDIDRTSVHSVRNVRAHTMHPWFDLALVIMDRPYINLDQLPNATIISMKLRHHGVLRWMKVYFRAYAYTRNPHHHLKNVAREMKTNHYPFWMFFLTMLLPSTLFILFFIYITFYTGTPDEVPYNKLHNSKKVTHI